MTLDALAEVIAEDLGQIDLKTFIRSLLECCNIECIAEAVVKAEQAKRDEESQADKPKNRS